MGDNDQYTEEEYQDIVREIKEYNDSHNDVKIEWDVYCGKQEVEELNSKEAIVIFTSENMARCLDGGETQEVKLQIAKNCTEHFKLDGEKLRKYLTRTENFGKVFVVDSEDCEKINCLAGVPDERTFDVTVIDAEEFIGKL